MPHRALRKVGGKRTADPVANLLSAIEEAIFGDVVRFIQDRAGSRERRRAEGWRIRGTGERTDEALVLQVPIGNLEERDGDTRDGTRDGTK